MEITINFSKEDIEEVFAERASMLILVPKGKQFVANMGSMTYQGITCTLEDIPVEETELPF